MAETLDSQNEAFWLPSSFLTDDDDDFYNDEFVFSNSSLDSPVCSELFDKDDDFISELTRQLAHSSLHRSRTQKPWNLSTSPQSTLTGFGPWTTRNGFSSNGSPNGPSSPQLTPPAENDAAWELLYEAAGEIARLKINALAAQINHHKIQFNHHHNNQQNGGLLSAPRNVSRPSKHFHHHHHSSFYDFPQYEQVKRQGNGNLYCHHHNHNQRRSCNNSGPPFGLPKTAWPPLRPNNHHYRSPNGTVVWMRSDFRNGLGPGSGPMAGMKRQSTGTGVFLPRRTVDNGTSMAAAHKIQQAPELGKKTSEIMLARRNAVIEHQRNQRRSFIRNGEIRLPSDWTY